MANWMAPRPISHFCVLLTMFLMYKSLLFPE
jgi:hypothetical protein